MQSLKKIQVKDPDSQKFPSIQNKRIKKELISILSCSATIENVNRTLLTSVLPETRRGEDHKSLSSHTD